MAKSIKLLWEMGTAYDLFISLAVLYNPSDFGVRGSWASSVRKRLPPEEREMIKEGLNLIYIPFHWIHQLPDPKNAITVLYTLEKIPASKRLPTLKYLDEKCAFDSTLIEISERGSWTDNDIERLSDALGDEGIKKQLSKEKLINILDWWSRAGEFGQRYLNALKTYTEVFFSEEEKRIQPVLEAALEQAQSMAETLELPDLVEELSQGLRFEELPEMDELVLAPSYWVTPLMFLGEAGPNRGIWLFGARPGDESLVPGETVPDSMLRALKALSDPTRLRIMHYLSEKPLSPAELSRRLRLRPPTVTHHLQALRLAGLVKVTLGGQGKEKKIYSARSEAVKATYTALESFLALRTGLTGDEGE
jgi:DNA-binding transcriptional ArsR family regulator